MSAFLSDEWRESLNHRLTQLGPIDSLRDEGLRVVFELADAPPDGPNALCVILAPAGARIDLSAPSERDATVRLSYLDARRIYDGELNGALALSQGRLKILGDVATLTTALAWLDRARDVIAATEEPR